MVERTFDDVQISYHAFFRGAAGFLGGSWLGRRGVDPNKVTLTGMVLTLAACATWACQIYWLPAFWIGLAVAVFGAWFDLIDGSVARLGGRETEFGKQLDSVTDRAVEGGMYAALTCVVAHQVHGRLLPVAGCVMALAGSFAVTYARAKAENLNLNGKKGWGGRAERLVLLGVIVLVAKLTMIGEAHQWIHFHLGFEWAGYMVAILAWITVWQRMTSLKQQLAIRS